MFCLCYQNTKSIILGGFPLITSRPQTCKKSIFCLFHVRKGQKSPKGRALRRYKHYRVKDCRLGYKYVFFLEKKYKKRGGSGVRPDIGLSESTKIFFFSSKIQVLLARALSTRDYQNWF